MKNLLTACAIVITAIILYGFIRGGDRMRLTKIDEKRGLTLIVAMPDRDQRYVFLTVFACSAATTENGTYCTDDGWRTRSDRTIRMASEQVPFPDAPRGTVRFDALARDIDDNLIASSSLTIMRGF